MIHVAFFGIAAGWGVLLTYLVHSTAWIAGALLLTRPDRGLSPAARHVVWRAALLGPFASSAFALGLGHRWQWSLTRASPADEAWAAAAQYAATLSRLALAGPVELVRDAASPTAPFSVEVAETLPFTLLAGCASLVALVAVVLIARTRMRQRCALATRTRVTHAACLEALERLGKRAGIRRLVRLSRCAAAPTPLLLSSREICLPERVRELDQGALEAVLARELAHIERRDGWWLNGALILQALLWFQPLNRKVWAELQASAELAADDRAVELTGDPLTLARTLTHVASWAGSTAPAASLAMVLPRNGIGERVARLVTTRDGRSDPHLGPRTPWFALAALVAVGACSPSVGAPQAERPRAGIGSAKPERPGAMRPLAVVASNPAPLIDANRAPLERPAADAATTGDDPDRLAPLPELAIEGIVSEIVASVVPRAIEFGQTVSELALDELQLAQRLERAKKAAAMAGAAARAGAEVERLKRELAASSERREKLEREFEARMNAWSKEFEQRFERDHAPRFAAWGERLARRMEAMAKDLDRQLSGLRSIPQPPDTANPPPWAPFPPSSPTPGSSMTPIPPPPVPNVSPQPPRD